VLFIAGGVDVAGNVLLPEFEGEEISVFFGRWAVGVAVFGEGLEVEVEIGSAFVAEEWETIFPRN
jgi:hypothetical protein